MESEKITEIEIAEFIKRKLDRDESDLKNAEAKVETLKIKVKASREFLKAFGYDPDYIAGPTKIN